MQGNSLMTFLPFLIILLLFVPLILNTRKQKRAMNETQAMQQALEAGDVVITMSGLRGRVTDASYEETIDIEIAEGVVTTWLRGAVREKVNPDATDHTPADDESGDDSATTSTTTTASESKPAPSDGKPIVH